MARTPYRLSLPRRLLWFAGLWLAGVATVLLAAALLRAVLA
jgi:hypothetical protein